MVSRKTRETSRRFPNLREVRKHRGRKRLACGPGFVLPLSTSGTLVATLTENRGKWFRNRVENDDEDEGGGR